MADGLVDRQPQIGGVDHQVGRTGHHAGRLGLLGQQNREFGQFTRPVPDLVTGQRLPAAAGRRGERAHGLETARRWVHGHRLQSRHSAHSLLCDRRSERVGVVGLLLDAHHHRRHVVHPIGCQQPSGVLPQQGDLVSGGNAEWVDAVIRHPDRVGVDGFVGQVDPLGVERGQRPRHPDGVPGRLRGDLGAQAGMRGEAPGAVDDHPHRQSDLAIQHRGLQFSVAQVHGLGGDRVHPKVGVTGAGHPGGRECGIGQRTQRQGQEVGVDATLRSGSVRTHRITVAGGAERPCGVVDGLVGAGGARTLAARSRRIPRFPVRSPARTPLRRCPAPPSPPAAAATAPPQSGRCRRGR